MARPISVLRLTPQEQSELQRRVRAPTSSQRDGLRARIVLLRGEGLKEKDVAEKLATSVTTVSLWSQRFERNRLEGLRDKPAVRAQAVAAPRENSKGDHTGDADMALSTSCANIAGVLR